MHRRPRVGTRQAVARGACSWISIPSRTQFLFDQLIVFHNHMLEEFRLAFEADAAKFALERHVLALFALGVGGRSDDHVRITRATRITAILGAIRAANRGIGPGFGLIAEQL